MMLSERGGGTAPSALATVALEVAFVAEDTFLQKSRQSTKVTAGHHPFMPSGCAMQEQLVETKIKTASNTDGTYHTWAQVASTHWNNLTCSFFLAPSFSLTSTILSIAFSHMFPNIPPPSIFKEVLLLRGPCRCHLIANGCVRSGSVCGDCRNPLDLCGRTERADTRQQTRAPLAHPRTSTTQSADILTGEAH
jgi:hypothetical protein